MSEPLLSVREIKQTDIELIIDYWLGADPAFLTGMGVDLTKLPDESAWRNMLMEQLSQPYEEKKSYCVIWLEGDKPVGHSNINKIQFGDHAYMHLHLWNQGERKKGYGTRFVKLFLPYFFGNYQLKKLFCEPYALNPAPNKTLEKAGFEFVKEYTTIPGSINFEQSVCLWEMSFEKFKTFDV